MATLIVLIPPRVRLAPGSASPSGAESGMPPRASGEYNYALSEDGLTMNGEGRCAAAQLPRADTVIAVLSDADVSWHKVTLPRANAARLRAALGGQLEEALLEDVGLQHLAVAPGSSAGQPAWIAAVNKSWLLAELEALEKARVFVERVVPSSWPDEPPSGHFAQAPHESAAVGEMLFTWAHATGVVTLPVKGGFTKTLLPLDAHPTARWSAEPAVAAPAERWLGSPVVVLSASERALLATRSLWNLRQFDLATRARGSRAMGDLWRQLKAPAWRPARFGLVTLVVVQLLGLNLWAWHQRNTVEEKRQSLTALLRTTFPQVRAVLDAPLQMQRETDTLRATAGRPGDADLEPLLAAAASAWPQGLPAVETLRYEPGRLTLAARGWTETQIAQFTAQLRGAGWRVESAEGRLLLSRASAATAL